MRFRLGPLAVQPPQAPRASSNQVQPRKVAPVLSAKESRVSDPEPASRVTRAPSHSTATQKKDQPKPAQHTSNVETSQNITPLEGAEKQDYTKVAHQPGSVNISQDGNQPGPTSSREIRKPETVQYDAERERIRSKTALWDQVAKVVEAEVVPLIAEEQRFTPSDQIYVMGMDPVGRYIVHALAGCESLPPPIYMIHSYQLRRGWDRIGRRLTLHDGDKVIPRDRIIAVDTSSADYELETSNKVIKNLIVTVPAAHVLRVLKPFIHRLDHRSTICLVNDGLGVAEDLINAYFPSIFKRPTFLLGHFTPKLGYTEDAYSVEKVRDGRLYLALFQQTIFDPLVRNRFKRHPPIERTQSAQHLLRLLTAVPDLYASGHPTQDFFRYKLPTVAFHSIVDPLTVLLDCTYDKLPRNAYARLLMDQMLGEICSVVGRMWECKNSQKFQQFMTSSKLRDEIWHKLMRRRTASSRMRTEVVRGRETDIAYQSGYFVKRGREQGLTMYTLDTVISEVKGKQQVAKARRDVDIPLEM
ncbi:ketopantoate reductase PanE/ApbA C terminal-domain-containing protein [Cladorrhinum sp. PSN332]|nr:ketopantoate reductase PanE/ApbA C terminal-domain-containing protein [Cladorrhinum sp. PSN332]